MKTIALALLVSVLTVTSACAQQPIRSTEFQPAQLKGFPRGQLTIQRAEGRDSFEIWLAQTPAQHQQGLMWIRELPDNYGMLFVLDAPHPMTMWMKNTYVALDMLFVDMTGRILVIAADTKPLSLDFIPSNVAVGAVLEIKAGETKRRGIKVGDRLLHAAFAQ
jgi:uncharacterized protein